MVLKKTDLERIWAQEWGVFQRDRPLVTVGMSLEFNLHIFSLSKVRSKLQCARSSEHCNRGAPSFHFAESLILHWLHKNNFNTSTTRERRNILQQQGKLIPPADLGNSLWPDNTSLTLSYKTKNAHTCKMFEIQLAYPLWKPNKGKNVPL